MPKTLDNHLVGVTADAPHPESERPDLPRRSEPTISNRQNAWYNKGFVAGVADRKRGSSERERDLEQQLHVAQEELTTLRRRLEAKSA